MKPRYGPRSSRASHSSSSTAKLDEPSSRVSLEGARSAAGPRSLGWALGEAPAHPSRSQDDGTTPRSPAVAVRPTGLQPCCAQARRVTPSNTADSGDLGPLPRSPPGLRRRRVHRPAIRVRRVLTAGGWPEPLHGWGYGSGHPAEGGETRSDSSGQRLLPPEGRHSRKLTAFSGEPYLHQLVQGPRRSRVTAATTRTCVFRRQFVDGLVPGGDAGGFWILLSPASNQMPSVGPDAHRS